MDIVEISNRSSSNDFIQYRFVRVDVEGFFPSRAVWNIYETFRIKYGDRAENPDRLFWV